MYARRWLPFVVFSLGFAVPALASQTLKTKFSCFGNPQAQINLSVTIDGSAWTLKWKGKGLQPNDRVTCGYACPFGGTAQSDSCGSADAAGKWKYTVEDQSPLERFGPAFRIQTSSDFCELFVD